MSAPTLTTRDLMRWLRPWPAKLPNRRWTLRVVTLHECSKLTAYWNVGSGEVSGRRTLGWWAKQAADGMIGDARQHYLHMLARFQIPVLTSLTALALKHRGIVTVMDGNHHLVAAMMVRFHGYGGLGCPVGHVGLWT